MLNIVDLIIILMILFGAVIGFKRHGHTEIASICREPTMRMTQKLAEKLFYSWKYKEGTTMRWAEWMKS